MKQIAYRGFSDDPMKAFKAGTQSILFVMSPGGTCLHCHFTHLNSHSSLYHFGQLLKGSQLNKAFLSGHAISSDVLG